MTEQQQAELIKAAAPLVENPTAWRDLGDEARGLFMLLFPRPSFTEEQRFWLSRWWLPVDDETIAALNEAAPRNTSIHASTDLAGDRFVSADLLSDAIDGRRLSALLPILETLPLHYRPPEAWPQPEIFED
jgi:hypothetical protein